MPLDVWSGDEPFDYIVVGSGAGGGTVAARLAERGARVLVLEAGSDPRAPGPDAAGLPEQYDVPAFHPLASENPAISWDFFVRHYTDPAQQARDPKLTPRGVFYPRAGTLGGCTAHNAMITLWPADADWDGIAALTGEPAWRAAAMRKLIRRLEQCRHRPVWRFLSRFGLRPTGHGWNGWLPTEKALPPQVWGDQTLIRMLFLEAVRLELGEPKLVRQLWRLLQGQADPNDRRILRSRASGLCYTPLSTDHGARFGTRERLLDVAARLPDRLRIELDALVCRVVLDAQQRAVGVEYMKGKRLYRAAPGTDADGPVRVVRCTREVILAGGAFNTPQLLMLSGIGDPAELDRHGLPTRVAIPGVGRNLQDRYEVAVVSRMAHDWRVLAGAEFRRGDAPFEEWHDDREGMYVSNGAALGFTARSAKHLRTLDLFCMALLARFNGYVPGYSAEIAAHHDALSWAILKGQTGNRAGRVRLRSADPRDTPEIDFNYFAECGEADLAAMVTAVKQVRGLLRPLAERGLVAAEDIPGPGVRTNAEIARWVRDTAWGHHACGSAAIGPRDTGGVLDGRLVVHGTQGLRVVDASIFPRIPGFFITGAIYLAAEQAADFILAGARSAGARTSAEGLPV
ncbi:MAG: GMC family oxidoreductase [Acetobacteraceae bacterium]|nr:GMC family oxidoreductase [Acetobacteraceae bacterium]